LYPNGRFARAIAGNIDFGFKRTAQGIAELQEVAGVEGGFPLLTAYLSFAYDRIGDPVKAHAAFDDLNHRSLTEFVSPYCWAVVYLGLSDRERTLSALEQAYEARSQLLPFIKEDAIWNPLRGEPRFQELLRKMHLDG